MKIFPQDLRPRQHATIIRRRSYGLKSKDTPSGYEAVSLSAEPPAPRMGKLGKIWARGSDLSDKQAAVGLPAASMSTLGTAWAAPGIIGPLLALVGVIAAKEGAPPLLLAGGTAAITGAIAYLGSVPWARAAFRSLYKKPLQLSEVDALLSGTEMSELERAHLTLVRDAVRQDAPDGADEDLRAAITALGEAIDRLPVITVSPVDTAVLRSEADVLLAEALNHDDRVIAGSLERRADALIRRADASDRSAQYVRRAHALREEIEAQIEALREAIAAFDCGQDVGLSDLSNLSESARRVAHEAVSAAAARAELDGVWEEKDEGKRIKDKIGEDGAVETSAHVYASEPEADAPRIEVGRR